MIIYYITEPSYQKTIWFKETMNGIEKKSNLLKYKLHSISESEITEGIKVLMIIGTAPAWVSKIADICHGFNIVTLIISCHSIHQNTSSSYVLINHDDATRQCIDYLKQCGRRHIALYGVNTDSYADMIKKNYFDQNSIYYIGAENKLKSCFEKFRLDVQKYDAVVCTNYISAVFLICELKKTGIEIPKDLYVVCYGESILGRRAVPSVTTVTLDHMLLGQQAVQVYKYICKSADKVALTVSVPCKMIPAASTDYKAYIENKALTGYTDIDDFSDDEAIIAIQNLERLLRETDQTDIEIIEAIKQKESISDISDRLYISIGGIKYRKKKMLEISGFDDIEQLIKVYTKYLN